MSEILARNISEINQIYPVPLQAGQKVSKYSYWIWVFHAKSDADGCNMHNNGNNSHHHNHNNNNNNNDEGCKLGTKRWNSRVFPMHKIKLTFRYVTSANENITN